MENDNCIAVTHFINPHLFWYKNIEAPDEQLQLLNAVEQTLLELYKNKPKCNYFLRPQIGDKLAVNFIAWNKFIRAEVLHEVEFQQEGYILWALDYGFPLLTKKEHLRNLPTNLQVDIGHIQIGGIANIYPAEQEYDDMEGNLVMVKKDKWSQRTCNVLEKLLADANSISFYKHYQTENNHGWGDLIIVNHKGIEINARDFLLKTTNAIEENKFTFKQTCTKFKTIKIAPWLSNDRNTKMKFNNIKQNYIEHSKQMNATLVDENAKRKVEDWHKRNERKKNEFSTDIVEASCEVYDDNVDEVTFDDSVSMAQSQQMNYIGKVGILTKIKQSKYPSNKDCPPPALPKSFEIDVLSDLSSQHSSYLDPCTETLSAHRIKQDATKGLKEEILRSELSSIQSQSELLIDLESNASSKSSSIKQSQKKLYEMRKKVARTEKERKKDESVVRIPMDNKSESAKSLRIKHLMAMRKKLESSITASTNNSIQTNTAANKMQLSIPNIHSKNDMDKNNTESQNNQNFKEKSETISKPEDSIQQLHQGFSVALNYRDKIKESLKLSQSGYDNLTMVPAGYDITRLQTYNDEKNHWHRKKSTRYDYIPHEEALSTGDIPSDNFIDKGLSSSDSSQIKPQNSLSQRPKQITVHTKEKANTANVKTDALLKSWSHEQTLNQTFEVMNLAEGNLSSEFSTSLISPILNRKFGKNEHITSTTSQIIKIDNILQNHYVEEKLHLKLINKGYSSQKTLAPSTSSNNSCNDMNTSITVKKSNPNNICSELSSSADNIGNEKRTQVFNNLPLVDVMHTEYLPIVEGESEMQTKFIDQLILVHSTIPLTSIEMVSEAPFIREIHDQMRLMRVNKVYRIQVYSWIHILRNNSLFVVNPPRSGKTWSYLPALCSLLCSRKNVFKPSYGPVAIILVASLKHVELVNYYCRRLMSGLKTEAPKCVPTCGMRNFIETKVELLNGCGILVATPSNVLRLLHENENEPLFDAERLQHIVIDDMDLMMSRSKQDFGNACSILLKMAKKTKLNKVLTQLIVTSRDWDGLMVKLIRKCNQPLLLIGDFLEAAVYGHATLSVKLKYNIEKNETILKFLKKTSESAQCLNNRTLIMCNGNEEAQNVYTFLEDHGYPCLIYYSRSTEKERVVIDEWKNKISSQILICTDACFNHLKIQNVNNLIHFSLPASWTQFKSRFSAFINTYNNYVTCFVSNTLCTTSTANKYNAYSLILLDENNNLELPRLVNFMRKHNQIVQDEIQAVSRRVLIMREEERILNNSLLCPQLLEFGECDETRCDNRHELMKYDVISKNDGIPCSGDIRIHVLKVFSPTYYTVRLLQHKPFNGTKWCETRRCSEALNFNIQFNMYYSNDKNLFLHWPPHINDLCIYRHESNFKRARILKAPALQTKETNVVQSNLRVTLKLIDDGSVVSSVKCNEIFVCNEKFKDFPPQAIDVRLMKVVPFDNERSWDSITTKQVQKWIMDDIKLNYVVQASIDFSLANTIWVKNVVVMEKLSGIDAYCQVVNLKKSLVEKNFGVLYNGNRKHVRDIAEEHGLLNSFEFEIEDSDYDLDYQSCKNENINLITFSSSNDESIERSMKSSPNGLEPVTVIENKTTDWGTNNKEKSEHVKIKNQTNDGEIRDCNLGVGQQLAEVYVPLKIKHVDKSTNLEHCKVTVPSKEETWAKLVMNELIKVEIGDEGENGNWENIFLQLIDRNSTLIFEELNKLISKHVEKIKSKKENQVEIYDFEPLQNCIVRYNNLYLRAKVYGVYGEKLEQRLYRFFLCDYACFANAKSEDLYNDFLYETTEEIITFTPYQAVHCTLAGIKWDKFTKRYQVTKDYLYACAVLEMDSKHKPVSNLHYLPIRSYKILLYECEVENEFKNALCFNKTLVDNGITTYDEETKEYLEYEINIEETEKSRPNNGSNNKLEEIISIPNENNKDDVFTYEQLIDCFNTNAFDVELDEAFISELKSLQNNNFEIKNQDSIYETENKIDNLKPCAEKEKNEVLKQKCEVPILDSELEQGNCTSNSNNSKKSPEYYSSPPTLKVLHKRPTTTWYQNDYMIYISIHAPDIEDYLLEVTTKTVLFIAKIQSEKAVLILNLLGTVDAKTVSHEIKGLNVVIRLKKNVFLKWPRLLQESTKYYWLNYNFNNFDSTEEEILVPQQCLNTILDNKLSFGSQQSDDSNSDDDNEIHKSYHLIEGNNDDCDPFSSF